MQRNRQTFEAELAWFSFNARALWFVVALIHAAGGEPK